jgi:surface antigen
MSGPAAPVAPRLPSYSGTALASLRLIAVTALALTAGGCATFSLGSMFSGSKKESAQAYASEDVTGSTATRQAAASVSSANSETDLVFARMAIVEVLGRNSKDVSAPWENPSSGARGTVTPIATAYSKDGATCHGFLASYVRRGAESWLQGEACRVAKGKWEVKSLGPWART